MQKKSGPKFQLRDARSSLKVSVIFFFPKGVQLNIKFRVPTILPGPFFLSFGVKLYQFFVPHILCNTVHTKKINHRIVF